MFIKSMLRVKSVCHFIGLIFVFAQVFPGFALASEFCAIRGAKDNLANCILEHCSTSDRTRSVQFPDGREIWIVGHNHGPRGYVRQMIQQFSQYPLVESELNALLDKILQDSPIALKNAEEDLPFFDRFLQTRSSSSFIGVETFQENINPHFNLAVRLRQQAFESGSYLSLETRNKLDKVLLAVFGPHLYRYTDGSVDFRKFSLRGFESESEGDNENQIDKNRSNVYRDLINSLSGDQVLLKEMVDTRASFILLHEDYEPLAYDTKVLNAIRVSKKIPSPWRPKVEDWVKTELATLKARYQRDQTAARGMAQEKQDGILFVGQLHLNALARLVQEECYKESQLDKRATSANRDRIPQGPKATR